MDKILLKAAALSVCAAVTFSLTACGKKSSSAEIEIPILETSAPVYNTVKAEIGSISEKYYGEASYGISHEMTASFTRAGQIKEINVELNKQVKKGDVLCVLRSEEIEQQIEEADVWLEQSESTYNKLLAKGNVPAAELEYARIDYELQKLNHARLERELAQYTVKAPCDGTITWINDRNRELNVNTKVYPDWLCTISDNSENALSCKMIQKIDHVGYGTKVIITSTLGEYEGYVTGEREYGEGATAQYIYEIRCDDDDVSGANKFKVCFDVYDKDDVVLVPAKAIKAIGERRFVNLLVGGVKVEQDVETGIEDGEMVEITNGLVGGEEIIINGE